MNIFKGKITRRGSIHKAKQQLVKTVACISAISMVTASFSSVSLAKEPEDVNNPVVIEASEEVTADEVTETAEEEEVPAAEESEEEIADEDSEETDAEETEETDAEDATETDAEDTKETAVEDTEETDVENAEESWEIDAEDSEVIGKEDADLISADSETEIDSEEAVFEEKEVKEAVELAPPTNGWYKDESSLHNGGYNFLFFIFTSYVILIQKMQLFIIKLC